MRICYNVPRFFVEGYDKPIPNDYAWISIQEEDQPNAAPPRFYPPTKNEFFDKLNNLKLKFSDVEEVIEKKGLKSFHKSEFYNPPTKRDAKKIVDFVLANTDKHIIINCAAGISRSGAISLFLHDILGYKWDEHSKGVAQPNMLLYRMLVDYYQTVKEKKTDVEQN